MSPVWKKVVEDIIKYAIGAVLGALGFGSITGCMIPLIF